VTALDSSQACGVLPDRYDYELEHFNENQQRPTADQEQPCITLHTHWVDLSDQEQRMIALR
jgi:hypothetical protein